MAENKDMQSGNLLDKSEEKQAEKERNDANNANTIKNAADVAIASKNPYAVAIGEGIKVADKVTGGKSTEMLGKNMTRNLKHTPGGKKIQDASNELSESGTGDKIGQAASMVGSGSKGTGEGAEKSNNLINDSKRNNLDSHNKMNHNNNLDNENKYNKHSNENNFNNNRDSLDDGNTNNKESLNSEEEKRKKKKKKSEEKEKKFSFLDIDEDEEGNKTFSIDFVGLIGKKYLLIGGALLFLVVIIVASFAASISSPASASGEEMNEGICMLDNNNTGDDCEENSEAAKAFHKLVKELKKEYSEDGKKFNATYIAGFYVVVSNEKGSNLTYESFTKDKIKKVIDAMFDKDGNFSEDTFKENLEKDILPGYISGQDSKYYKKIVNKIFDYASRYKEIYGEEEQEEEEDNTDYSDSDYAIKLVKVAQDQLKDSNSSKVGGAKYKKFVGLGWGGPWCAAFVSWCANKAGIPKSVITHTQGVDGFITQGRNQNTIHAALSDYEPKPGDLVIWKQRDWPNSATSSHVGIVEKYNSKTKMVSTIEGNTGTWDNTTSYVGTHTHPKNTIGAFISPKYPQTNGKLKGNTIILPSGLGTYGTWMFDLASTQDKVKYVRSHGIQSPHGYPDGTPQRKVQDAWIKTGGKYKDGFCALDGRYLIAVTKTFGDFGDKVDFYMSGGKVIPTVIIEHKSMVKTSYDQHPANKWGHADGKNVLEFVGHKDKVGNDQYKVLGIKGQTVKKAVNGGSIYK